jgi:hypothetical protein
MGKKSSRRSVRFVLQQVPRKIASMQEISEASMQEGNRDRSCSEGNVLGRMA